MDGVPKAMTEYEAERARRIAENKAKMSQMGLADASRALTHVVATQARGEQRAPRLRGPRTAASKPPPGPPRASKRLRGCNAPEVDASKEEPRIEGGSNTVTEGKRKEKLTLDPNTAYAAPFTLASIGTTVWELGAIHRGPWAQRYWSSSQCLFHHAYPVGYRATKVAFGSTYEMRIEAGEQGPVFSVTNMDTGARFEGTSPTKPWTSVCISHRTGQRISGPLYFGFSDPITHRAIASNLYSERELQAALQGERIEAEELSAEELAAKEFMQVSGIGEAVAMKLACTTELGGVKHRGLASLKAWVCASADNDAAMREYLLESEEIPGVTRKWPAWRARMVPNIMAALTGRGEIEAEDGGEGGGKERVEDLAEGAKENEAPRASAGGTADCCAQGAEGGVGDAGVVMLADATNA